MNTIPAAAEYTARSARTKLAHYGIPESGDPTDTQLRRAADRYWDIYRYVGSKRGVHAADRVQRMREVIAEWRAALV